jgi:hypothetical protein
MLLIQLMHDALNMAGPEANFRPHEETDNAKLSNCGYSGAITQQNFN